MSKNGSHKGIGAAREHNRRRTLVQKKKAEWFPMNQHDPEVAWVKAGLPEV